MCRSVVHGLKARHDGQRISLIDARAAPEQVAKLAARGLDLDEGIVVKAGEAYFSGAEATRYLARLHAPAGWLERFAAWGFGSPRRAALVYPLFRALRRVLLVALRRPPINGGEGRGRR